MAPDDAPRTGGDAHHPLASAWLLARTAPRLLRSALHRGILPAGVSTLRTLWHEGWSDLHWKAVGDALTRFLQGAGPLATKLGQILATREDLLAVPLCRRLERLYADQPPMRRRQLESALARAYSGAEGSPFSTGAEGSPFSDFDWTPLAVGSIGQVHRARLADGSRVVVKLLRPGIAEALERDLRSARALLDLLFRGSGADAQAQRGSALRALDDLSDALKQEVDLVLEAGALEEFGKRLVGNPRVCVPRCHRALCTREVLVLEELEGVPLSALRDQRDTRPDHARRAADLALGEILAQIFRDGHFHADPHAGNLLLLEDGRLALIDLGLTGRLDDRERRSIARAVRAFVSRDPEATIGRLLELGELPRDFDFAAFRADVKAVLRRHGRAVADRTRGSRSGGEGAELPASGAGAGAASNRLEQMVDELFSATRRHRVWLPRSTTLLIKTLVTIEGVARSLDPDIDVVLKAAPIIARSLLPGWLGFLRRARA